MRIDDAALQVMKEQDTGLIWYGHPQLCHDVAARAGCGNGHPLNIIGKVLSALSWSPKFRRSGYITHLGRRYPTFKPA